MYVPLYPAAHHSTQQDTRQLLQEPLVSFVRLVDVRLLSTRLVELAVGLVDVAMGARGHGRAHVGRRVMGLALSASAQAVDSQ